MRHGPLVQAVLPPAMSWDGREENRGLHERRFYHKSHVESDTEVVEEEKPGIAYVPIFFIFRRISFACHSGVNGHRSLRDVFASETPKRPPTIMRDELLK